MGVSENSGPSYVTLNRRIFIIRTPKQGTPNPRQLPYTFWLREGAGLLSG